MKRQFIWIMTDTTRYDMLGCYGNPLIQTPNLDYMSQEGIRFERVYTTQPVCGPARSALFTGMFPHSNGCWGNSMPLGSDVSTLGQRLSQNGITCTFIGKWHLDGGDYFGKGQCPNGWNPEYWYDMKCYLEELTPEERLASRKNDHAYPAEFTYGYRCTQRALRFLERHKDDDFFLVVSYDEPHDPGLCPQPYYDMYRQTDWLKTQAHYDTLEGKPEYQKLWAGEQRTVNRDKLHVQNPGLLGCNSFIDSQIGRILNAAKSLAPYSMRMFTSDHGDALNAHCLNAKGPAVYDDIARVPLIFMGGGAACQTVYPHTVSQIDLPATVMTYFGFPIPNSFQGQSLLAQVQGNGVETMRPAFVEFNRYEIDHDGFGGFQPMRAVVTDEYKLALHLLDIDELYVVGEDAFNVKNRIDDPALTHKRNELHDQILTWMNDTRDPFRGYQWKCRAWRAEYTPSWRVDGYTRQKENEPGEPRQLDYSSGLEIIESVRKK